MKHPKLTIALQTHNRGEGGYLQAAMAGILGQTYGDFELLVLDNHSTDGTCEIIQSYRDPRITYIRFPPGGNPSTSQARGLRISRGDYVLVTHDDDVMEPTMTARQMAFVAQQPNLVCLATNVSLMDTAGRTIQPSLYALEADRVFPVGTYIGAYLDEKLWLPTPTLLHRRTSLFRHLRTRTLANEVPYFPSGDIWLMFLQNLHGPIGILAEPLLRYRQHPGQESRNVDQSGPLAELSRRLMGLKARHGIRAILPAIEGAYARYQAQDLLLRSDGGNPALLRVLDLGERWQRAVPPAERGMDIALPFEILLGLLQHAPTIPPEALASLEGSPAREGARVAYRRWTRILHRGGTLFGSGPARRIVIFGSMFTAFLLVLDARQSGVEVAACVDSAPARIGRSVFGVPVLPMDRMAALAGSIDAVVLSNERDQEESVRHLLAPLLGPGGTPVLSWKDLAEAGA